MMVFSYMLPGSRPGAVSVLFDSPTHRSNRSDGVTATTVEDGAYA